MIPHARRDQARIEFPPASGPQLQTSGRTFDILDLSTGGLRFRAPRLPAGSVTAGDVLRGIIHFRPGKAVEVRGKILRVSRGQVAAQLDIGVPFETILEERHYPPRRRSGMAW